LIHIYRMTKFFSSNQAFDWIFSSYKLRAGWIWLGLSWQFFLIFYHDLFVYWFWWCIFFKHIIQNLLTPCKMHFSVLQSSTTRKKKKKHFSILQSSTTKKRRGNNTVQNLSLLIGLLILRHPFYFLFLSP